ncbi:MAG: TPM domain-containing protein [Bacteroidota bacterium]
MRKITIITLCIFIFTFGLFVNAQEGREFPRDYSPQAWVNDYADLFPQNDERYLNNKLSAYEDTTSTQIFIVTLNSDMHENMPVEMMGATIGEEWKIGQGENDNGMIILIYPEDRKITIQTGYGLEEHIPDALAKRIIEKEIKPNFADERYVKGLDEATNVLFSLLSGEFTAEEYRNQSAGSPAPFGFLIILVLFFIFFGQSRRKRAHGVGRNLPFWLALTMLSGTRHSHRGSFGNFRSGSGSFGGFGGGGFRGGGGGSFGGGGASGSW